MRHKLIEIDIYMHTHALIYISAAFYQKKNITVLKTSQDSYFIKQKKKKFTLILYMGRDKINKIASENA